MAYNKRSRSYSVVPVKVEKQYSYVPNLLVKVLKERLSVFRGQPKRTGLLPDYPARICNTIVVAPKPSKANLIKRHRSRFDKKE